VTTLARAAFGHLIGFVFAFVLSVGAAHAYILNSDEGRFSIELPAQADFKTFNEQSELGPHTRYQWLVDQGEKAWLVTYNDYPQPRAGGDTEKAYDIGMNGSIQATKGTLKSQRSVENSGVRGREFYIELPGGQIIRQRLFIVGKRLYQNIYVGPAGTENGLEVENFLPSFRIRS
jgi:hypothetical protein